MRKALALPQQAIREREQQVELRSSRGTHRDLEDNLRIGRMKDDSYGIIASLGATGSTSYRTIELPVKNTDLPRFRLEQTIAATPA